MPLAILAFHPSLQSELVAPKRWASHALVAVLLLWVRPRRSALEALALSALLWLGLCASLSPVGPATFRPAWDEALTLLLILAVARSRVLRQDLLTGLELALGVTVAVALLDGWVDLGHLVPAASRPAGTLGSRAVAAEFLTGMLPLLMAARRPTRPRLMLFATSFALLLAARGRAAILGALLGLFWTHWRLGPKRARPWHWALAVGLALSFGVAQAPRWHWAEEAPYTASVASLFQRTAWGRLDTWRNTLSMAASHPLIGYGPGAFRFAYGAFARVAVPDHSFGVAVQIEEPHNEFLRILIETGLPGVLLALALALGWWRRGRRPARILGSGLALLVPAATSLTLLSTPTQLLAACLLGLLWRRKVVPERAFRPGSAALAGAVLLVSLALDASELQGLRAFRVGEQARALGRVREAISGYAEAGSRLHQSDPWLRASGAALEAGDIARCAVFAEQALRLSPQSPRGLVQRGDCALRAGRLAEAEHGYQKAIDLLPSNYLALERLGRVAHARGQAPLEEERRAQARQALQEEIPRIPQVSGAAQLAEAERLLAQLAGAPQGP